MQSYPSPSAGPGGERGGFYPSSGQHQPGIPNSDELRITAQLSRGLEPTLNAGMGPNMTDGQEPRGQSQGNIRGYDHEHARSPPMQGGSVDQMDAHYGPQDGSSAPRKRSKVSRACDECRRKKIRCDASEEAPGALCTSCKRTGSRCEFSRVPMKRGPSKGYIKELADRLNTLESTMHGTNEIPMSYLGHENPALGRRSEEFSPPPSSDSIPRKRTHSTSEFGGTLFSQRTQPSWSPSNVARTLPNIPPSVPGFSSQPPVFKVSNLIPNLPSSIGSGELGTSQEWRGEITNEHHLQATALENLPTSISEHQIEWDDSLIDSYYRNIHSTYMILDSNTSRLRNRLDKIPVILRSAFFQALQAAVQYFSSPNDQALETSIYKTSQIISSSKFESCSRTLDTDRIYVQILLLLVIATDNSPFAALKSHHRLVKSNFLPDAISHAYSMRLYAPRAETDPNDSDSDYELSRQIWWAMVTMDRWTALTTGRPTLIPESLISVYPDDVHVLGQSVYQVGRLSIIQNHSTMLLLTDERDRPPFDINTTRVQGFVLKGELERFRESLPNDLVSDKVPLVFMSYYATRILVQLHLTDLDPLTMVDPAKSLATLVCTYEPFPLVHYCMILCALTLLELLEYEQTRKAAEECLRLLDSRVAQSGWGAAVREVITNRLQGPSSASLGLATPTAESQHASEARQNLQQLAEVATATKQDRDVAAEQEGEQSPAGMTQNATATSANTTKATTALLSAPVSTTQPLAKLRALVISGYIHALLKAGEAAR